MKHIGLISDTHGYLDERVFQYFKDCDEIWHAGDIGENDVLSQLDAFKDLRVVYGNIDTPKLQRELAEDLIFEIEGIKVYMTHIGGKPPHYNPRVRKIIDAEKPNLFICGHSHILRIMPDAKRPQLLYINPGAAGHQGFHMMCTLIRFSINEGRILKPEVIELGKRGKI